MNSTFRISQKMYKVKNNTNGYLDGVIEPRIFTVAKWIGRSKSVLDAGCYNGIYSKIFLEGNNKVYGIDASIDAVEEAKKLGVLAAVADLEDKFPFKDQFFDVVHAGEVIEHIYDTDSFVSECKRVLKKDGLLIITTPNTLSLPRRLLYAIGSGRFFEASNTFSTEGQSVGHIRFFTKKLLKDYMEYNSFEMKRYKSDYVNLFFFKSKLLASVFPTLGRTLIMSFKKKG